MEKNKLVYQTVFKNGLYFISLNGNTLYEIPYEIEGVVNKGSYDKCPIEDGAEFTSDELELITVSTGAKNWYGDDKRVTYFKLK